MTITRSTLALFAALAMAMPAYAQNQQPDSGKATAAGPDKPVVAKPAPLITTPPLVIQHLRAPDKRGLNVFEFPKMDTLKYEGFKLSIGGSFLQDFQGLEHSNTADVKLVNNVNQNALMKIGHGFNNAVANLNINAQLAPGIRVAMTSYLSARHHQETWVKDGYLLIDDSPINFAPLKKIMEYVTIRAGHFEINYGDAHFRRTDNGSGIFNPMVANYIMDAFTTEIGGEVYFRTGPWLAMGGMTGGEVKGQVTAPEKRSQSYLGKLGFDKQLNSDLRVRLTGSTYIAPKSASNTLYTGDRGGSRYYDVLENTASTELANAWSGQIRPGFSNEARAFVVNPFVKFRGLEFFGNIEQSKGRASTEARARVWHQNVGELTYRFLRDEQAYVSARYNTAKGALAGFTTGDVRVERSQFGGGWFLTPNVLLKGEWVNQLFKDFPTTDIRHGGKFSGFMMEGVVSF